MRAGSLKKVAAVALATTNPVLRIRLSADYGGNPGVLRRIALDIDEGEIVGLVGESGSGKSTLALAIMRLLEDRGAITRGQVVFRSRHLELLSHREMRHIRGKEIALISQSAMASLNPALR